MLTKIQEKKEIRFKSYHQDFKINLPILIGELVKDNALVKIIDELVEKIPMEELEVYYSENGRPGYHPKMMIKVWTYGYCEGVYTSRPLAKQIRMNLGFMYLSGGQVPNFKTLSSFRSTRMKGMIDVVFKTVLSYLVEKDYIDLEDLYTDGSKWAANGNEYQRVWRKNTKRYKEGVLSRIGELLKEYEELQKSEDATYGKSDLKENQDEAQIKVILESSELQKMLTRMAEEVKEQGDKERRKRLLKIKKGLSKEAPKLDKYEEQERILDGRNSYSKTDEDATMMRMKDDRLLPGYNVEMTTSNQYAIAGSIHQSASDSVTLPSHWTVVEQNVSGLVSENWQPDSTMDAGYGSEENYEFMKKKGVRMFIKYPLWYKEHTGELAKKTYYFPNWTYHETQDYYQCPNDKKLIFKEHQTYTTRNGYERILKVYECESCQGCPFFKACRGERAKLDSNRTIRFSPKLEAHKAEVKLLLDTDEGKEKRAQRSVDVETPFGDIKHNRGHRRFVLRGLEKVRVEFLFLLLAHNVRKIECEQTGKWKEYYAQRAAKRELKAKKRA